MHTMFAHQMVITSYNAVTAVIAVEILPLSLLLPPSNLLSFVIPPQACTLISLFMLLCYCSHRRAMLSSSSLSLPLISKSSSYHPSILCWFVDVSYCSHSRCCRDNTVIILVVVALTHSKSSWPPNRAFPPSQAYTLFVADVIVIARTVAATILSSSSS